MSSRFRGPDRPRRGSPKRRRAATASAFDCDATYTPRPFAAWPTKTSVAAARSSTRARTAVEQRAIGGGGQVAVFEP